MKLSCEKCKKIFIVRTSDAKGFTTGDFICPDCQTSLKRTSRLKDGFKMASFSIKSLLSDEARNRSITRRIMKIYESIREQKISSMDLTIN